MCIINYLFSIKAEKWVSEMSPIPDDKDDYVDWGKIIANSPRSVTLICFYKLFAITLIGFCKLFAISLICFCRLCAIGDRVFGNLDPPLFGYESDDAKKPPATDPKK